MFCSINLFSYLQQCSIYCCLFYAPVFFGIVLSKTLYLIMSPGSLIIYLDVCWVFIWLFYLTLTVKLRNLTYGHLVTFAVFKMCLINGIDQIKVQLFVCDTSGLAAINKDFVISSYWAVRGQRWAEARGRVCVTSAYHGNI